MKTNKLSIIAASAMLVLMASCAGEDNTQSDNDKGSKEKEAERPEGDFHLRFPGVHFLGEYKEGKLRYRGKILFFTLLEGGEE